jgi:hypothetical protein
MTFLRTHWLGIAVLVTLAWEIAASYGGHFQRGAFPALLFLLTFSVWVIRGVIRWMGKQWRHSSETRQPTAR